MSKEKVKKPIFKKWWFWVVAIFGILIIYGANTGIDQAKEELKNQEAAAPAKEEKPKEDKKAEEANKEERKIKVDEKLLFAELTVNVQQVKIKDSKAIITFSWINQAGDGKKYFFALAGIDVTQNEDLLDEVSGAYDAKNKNTSDMYFHNAEGGEKKITLEYELKDKETPIEVTFVPLNDFNENPQKVTVDIN